ncbi:MAG: NAD(P)-dependent oxidoreductase [Rhizobiales bacterium PAR1]|nr:MAG: NAD(P)-dependent oxidoreductase [Rhizobiales bacterium PAR1]
MRLVIVGYGYSSAAIAREIRPRLATLHVTARSEDKVSRLRDEGLDALRFDGETLSPELAEALNRATHLLVSAPPDEAGDPLLRAPGFADRALPALKRVAYLSTVGVYGDHGGAWVDETSPVNPVSLRSRQRVAAETAWQTLAAARSVDLGIFRLSGIYGPGRSAIDNLRAGTARRIIKPGQVFNRIHVGDIGGAVATALCHQGPLDTFNLTDDEPCPPQDVVTYAASLLGVEPPPEIQFDQADLSPMGRSFYGENKRVANARIKAALGYAFRSPTYREGLASCF